jgi:hypothetical protein
MKTVMNDTVMSIHMTLAKRTTANAEANEVLRLHGQVEKLRTNLSHILGLADELKDKTIDTILEKDDLELGLDVLLGKHQL